MTVKEALSPAQTVRLKGCTVMTGAPACNGGAKPKVKQPKPKAEADAADLVAAAGAAAKAGDMDGADAKYREAEKIPNLSKCVCP